jgi:hypothetical protein
VTLSKKNILRWAPRKERDGSDDSDGAERVKGTEERALRDKSRPIFDAGASEDRLSIAAIRSEEGPNCGYVVEYTPCAANLKVTLRGFGTSNAMARY